jgi:NTP pyrophosphatase (non-canonical NTP hydrolase)
MTELEQYTTNALRTESRIKEVVVDPEFLAGVLSTFIAAGNMLDQIKKHVFYGKPYNIAKLREEFVNIVGTLDNIKTPVATEEFNEGVVGVDPRVFHALTGIATESSELMEALVKTISEGTADNVNLSEEGGDICWYLAILYDAIQQEWGKALETNIRKLQARFPEKFDSDRAIERDLDGERSILEKGME